MPCSDFSMGGENCSCLHFSEGFGEGGTFLYLFPDTFQHHKGAMSFVSMPYGGLDAQSSQGTDPTNSQHDFLLDTLLLVSGIETSTELSLLRHIAFNIRT